MTKKTHLAREMSARHIQMIALGGVIGTGLFLSSGYTIHQAGPLGTVIAYLLGRPNQIFGVNMKSPRIRHRNT